jgi:hypothetical protein
VSVVAHSRWSGSIPGWPLSPARPALPSCSHDALWQTPSDTDAVGVRRRSTCPFKIMDRVSMLCARSKITKGIESLPGCGRLGDVKVSCTCDRSRAVRHGSSLSRSGGGRTPLGPGPKAKRICLNARLCWCNWPSASERKKFVTNWV